MRSRSAAAICAWIVGSGLGGGAPRGGGRAGPPGAIGGPARERQGLRLDDGRAVHARRLDDRPHRRTCAASARRRSRPTMDLSVVKPAGRARRRDRIQGGAPVSTRAIAAPNTNAPNGRIGRSEPRAPRAQLQPSPAPTRRGGARPVRCCGGRGRTAAASPDQRLPPGRPPGGDDVPPSRAARTATSTAAGRFASTSSAAGNARSRGQIALAGALASAAVDRHAALGQIGPGRNGGRGGGGREDRTTRAQRHDGPAAERRPRRVSRRRPCGRLARPHPSGGANHGSVAGGRAALLARRRAAGGLLA